MISSRKVPRTTSHKIFQAFWVLSMLIAAPVVCGAEARYPENPIVASNAVFISSNGVHAYGRDDLQQRWSALLGEHTFEPVIHQHFLLVGSSGGLYALHTEDGRALWHVESNNEIFTPVVANGIAYAGSRAGTLYAFDSVSGQELWRAKFPGWVYSPAFIDGTLITGGQDATLWAVDPSNGERIWSQQLPGEIVFSPVAGAPLTVLATTFAADLIAFDAASGLQRWRLQTPAANMTTTVSGNRILMTGLDGRLRSIDLNHGTLDWETHLAGRLSSPRVVSGGHVLVSNDEGKLFVLRSEDGSSVDETSFELEPVGAPFLSRSRVVQFLQESRQPSIVAFTRTPVIGLTEE
jgi:outer membrane protein assembly factor BamB